MLTDSGFIDLLCFKIRLIAIKVATFKFGCYKPLRHVVKPFLFIRFGLDANTHDQSIHLALMVGNFVETFLLGALLQCNAAD